MAVSIHLDPYECRCGTLVEWVVFPAENGQAQAWGGLRIVEVESQERHACRLIADEKRAATTRNAFQLLMGVCDETVKGNKNAATGVHNDLGPTLKALLRIADDTKAAAFQARDAAEASEAVAAEMRTIARYVATRPQPQRPPQPPQPQPQPQQPITRRGGV